MNQVALAGAIEVGLIFGFVALGVYVSFRLLDFPDLTADGSFPLGAGTAAAALVAGWNPWVATGVAVLAGCLAGATTALLAVRFRILGLLAGILTMTALYSVNLRIMGRPNIALVGQKTVFNTISTLGIDYPWAIDVALVLFIAVAWAFVSLFFSTEVGLAMRATGVNPRMARAQGVDTDRMTSWGLAISNGLVAAGGALFAQANGFADVTSGIGTIVIGLASIILGETLFKTRSVPVLLVACVTGSVVYRLAVQGALALEVPWIQASDLSLITAVLVACALVLPAIRRRKLRLVSP